MLPKELEILKEAILIEAQGIQFYQLAAANVEDQEAKESFLFLAGEEVRHRQWLEQMFRNLSAQQPVPVALEDIMKPGQEPPAGIFDPAKIQPEFGSLAVSVFRIGMLIEKASIDFYQTAAEKSELEEARALYRRLVDWEGHHLERLTRIYDELKEMWWAKQGFSPA